MSEPLIERVEANPRYRALVHERAVLGWTLTAIVAASFAVLILLMGLAPGFIGERVSEDSAISIGFPLGIVVAALCMLSSGFYIWRANKDFDRLIDQIIKEAGTEDAPR